MTTAHTARRPVDGHGQGRGRLAATMRQPGLDGPPNLLRTVHQVLVGEAQDGPQVGSQRPEPAGVGPPRPAGPVELVSSSRAFLISRLVWLARSSAQVAMPPSAVRVLVRSAMGPWCLRLRQRLSDYPLRCGPSDPHMGAGPQRALRRSPANPPTAPAGMCVWPGFRAGRYPGHTPPTTTPSRKGYGLAKKLSSQCPAAAVCPATGGGSGAREGSRMPRAHRPLAGGPGSGYCLFTGPEGAPRATGSPARLPPASPAG